MGDIIIKLRGDLRTGEREILVEYEASPDLTPLEHERRHREIVEQLAAEGVISREETAELVFRPRPVEQTEGEKAVEGPS